jgi:hypothetical protein
MDDPSVPERRIEDTLCRSGVLDRDGSRTAEIELIRDGEETT